jgi:myo-inositol-1(or 4)-monophosphatase
MPATLPGRGGAADFSSAEADLTSAMLEELGALRDAALAAGTVLLDHLGGLARIERKGGVELVTELDLRVEELIRDRLARLFPDDAVHAEEAGLEPGGSERTWYLDPLDGTTNYVHGHPFFAISLGLVDAEGLRLGLIHAPYLDELYTAARGEGAWRERPRAGAGAQRLRREPDRELTQALLATGFPYDRGGLLDRNLGYVRAFLRAQCHGLRRGGSAALDLAYTAAGVLDGFWELGLRPWDVAAGTLLAREAGCLVTDLAGRGSDLTWEEIVAAPPGLHARMLPVFAVGDRIASGREE